MIKDKGAKIKEIAQREIRNHSFDFHPFWFVPRSLFLALYSFILLSLRINYQLLIFASPQARSSGNYVEYINLKEKWQLKSDCKDSVKKGNLFSTW
jgi:hypothetical protein